jgi:recombination protein RecR
MNATLEGQTTAHYIAERIERFPVRVTQLAHGLPRRVHREDHFVHPAALDAADQRVDAEIFGPHTLEPGLPVGGELDYLDEGTLAQALRARRPVV